MKQSIKFVLLAMLAALTGVMSYAQVTTSSLAGRIVDGAGEPVIGAAIVATHTPSGTTYGVVTNNDGRYTIQGMRTGGPYTVEISNLGYQNVSVTDVTLQLAETYNLNVTLKEATEQLADAIVIASPTSKFAMVEKTGASTNISNSAMNELPTVSRSITDVLKLSPYGGNGMSFGGMSGRFTNFTVDGANMNSNFGLNSSPLPGGGSPISIDAIEEMQVVVSPYDVRQSNFIGGGVNAITKSGTNTVKGTAYVYHRNENMHGNRIDGTELSERAIDRKTTYGFTLGGPVIKNKLFYFVNFENAVIPTTLNRWKPSEDGVADPDRNITRVSRAEAERMRNFLKTTYGYDAGAYDSYPADESNMKVLARIDWNINRNHHLALRYNFTDNIYWSMPSPSRDVPQATYNMMSQYGLVFANAMYAGHNQIQTYSFDLNSRLSDNLSNQLLVTYSKQFDPIRSSNSDEFPFVEILAGDLGNASEPYMNFGYELFTWKNKVLNNVFTVKDDLTWYKGAHKLMAGVSFESQVAVNTYMRNGTGMYQFASLSDFYGGNAPVAMAFDWGYDGEEEPSASVRFKQLGLYVQDEWNAGDRLKITAGLRFDTLLFDEEDVMTNNAILALDYGGRTIDTGRWPNNSVQFSPRLGFSWDVFGNRQLKVRGGTGLFAGRIPLVFFTNMPTNSLMVKGRAVSITEAAYPGLMSRFIQNGKMVTDKAEILNILNNYDASTFPKTITPEDGTLGNTLCGVDPDFKMPQIWKSSLGIDYTLPVSFPLTVSAEFVFNKTINAVMLTDYSILQDNSGWATFNGADNRHVYPSAYKYTYVNAKGETRNVPASYVLTNTNKGYGHITTVSVNAEPVRGLNITAAYTHTVNKEITAMPGSNASAAWQYIPAVEGPNFMNLHNAQYVNPDRLMASVSYTDKGHNHYSLLYEGWRYGGNSYLYSNDLNGDGVIYDLIYIPRDESEIHFVDADNAQRYWDFANQDAYLSAHKGQYAEAYAVSQPMVHTFDFRYAHDFVMKIGNTRNILQLSLDVVNVGNLFNSSWGVSKGFSPEAVSGRILTVDHIGTDGVPVFKTNLGANAQTWDYTHSYGNCWYMQVGIKYMFN